MGYRDLCLTGRFRGFEVENGEVFWDVPVFAAVVDGGDGGDVNVGDAVAGGGGVGGGEVARDVDDFVVRADGGGGVADNLDHTLRRYV